MSFTRPFVRMSFFPSRSTPAQIAYKQIKACGPFYPHSNTSCTTGYPNSPSPSWNSMEALPQTSKPSSELYNTWALTHRQTLTGCPSSRHTPISLHTTTIPQPTPRYSPTASGLVTSIKHKCHNTERNSSELSGRNRHSNRQLA